MRPRTTLGTTLLVAALFGSSAALADFFADFSKGDIRSDMSIKTEGCDNNPHYKGSYRLLYPNKSYVEATATLAEVPRQAILTLKHLSSSSAGVELKGRSPVSIVINGNAIAKDFDPGAHGYVKDEFNVAKYLQVGSNTVRIQLSGGSTHYWIKWMLLEVD